MTTLISLGNNLLGPVMDEYKSLMNDAFATFSGKLIVWQRNNITMNRFQEDSPIQPDEVQLQVLCNYNYKRSWPLNDVGEAGMNDEQSLQLILNKEYLRTNNLLDANGYFNYNEDFDRFIIDGTQYASFGDTAAGQMFDDDVFITIVVKRIQLTTSSKR